MTTKKPLPAAEQAEREDGSVRFSRLWSPKDVAWYLATSEGYVRGLRESDPSFPRPTPMPGGRLIRWWPAEIVAWVKGLEPPHGPDATDQPLSPRRGRKRTHVF